MGDLELLKWIPEGVSVMAVLVTVIVFLRHQKAQQDAHEKHLERLSTQFRDTVKHVANQNAGALDRLSLRLETHSGAMITMNDRLATLCGKLESNREKGP